MYLVWTVLAGPSVVIWFDSLQDYIIYIQTGLYSGHRSITDSQIQDSPSSGTSALRSPSAGRKSQHDIDRGFDRGAPPVLAKLLRLITACIQAGD